MVRNYLLLATFSLGVIFAEQATAQSWTQVGTLSCRVDPNIGFIIVGHQPMQCVYTQAPNAIPQVPPHVGLGLGAGANVLLGGSNRTIALQPLSLQGSTAINVIAGVSSLKLRWH
jgi:hypothetical protein